MNDVNAMVLHAFTLMAQGMGTVFFVLGFFYLAIKGMMKLFPEDGE